MSQTFRRPAGALLLGLLAVIFSSSSRAEGIKLGGTGAATEFLRRLGSAFTAQTGIATEVVPGIGSSGALRAAGDGAIDIVAAGRPLTPAETAKGLAVAFSLRTPFAFVTSHPAPQGLSLAEIGRAYAAPNMAWASGEPMRVILRPKLEGDTILMETLFPSLKTAIETARRRPDIPVAATDQDNADLVERTPGSISGMTYLQAVMEKRNLRMITLDGVEPTLENFERGAYPYGKSIDFVISAQPKPEVDRFLAFVRSPGGQELYRRAHGY
jgi:phosphate transport system substrate-binding protein